MGHSRILFLVGSAVVIAFGIAEIPTITDQHSSNFELRAQSRPGIFNWLRPSPVPKDWKSVTIPSGTATLAYPLNFHRIAGDPGSVSAAVISGAGHYLAYLNVTPKQGDEGLKNWPQIRLRHLSQDDNVSVHEVAQVSNKPFNGGLGTCIIDDYVTAVGHNHFKEISCFVKGSKGGTVVVAAASSPAWKDYVDQLKVAIASFKVS